MKHVLIYVELGLYESFGNATLGCGRGCQWGGEGDFIGGRGCEGTLRGGGEGGAVGVVEDHMEGFYCQWCDSES